MSNWPMLKHYDRDHLASIAMPIGGIGTGTISLGGRGDLRDWELMNRPAKGFVPRGEGGRGAGPFFALYAKPAGGPSVTRALEGPVDVAEYQGASGSVAVNHGLPRFAQCAFAAAYPLAQVQLSDPQVPVAVCLEAFNPLIPANADDSGIPIAVLRYTLTNRTNKRVAASVCGSLPNFIGNDGVEELARANRNRFRQATHCQGIFMDSEGVDPAAISYGTMALTTTAKTGITYRTAWKKAGWGTSLLDFWDDFAADGRVEERPGAGADMPSASLVVRTNILPKAHKTITFLLTWHFPNRHTWSPGDDPYLGNYYATHYGDAWDVAGKTAPRLKKLEQQTVRFVQAFAASDLPEVVKEAALFNLSTLRTQTCFRTPDGRLFGWEGYNDHSGCCMGSCTHVWNYEQSTAFLFGDLARTMRDTEFNHATDDNGMMNFRVHLPLSRAQEFGKAAADGQMGCIMKAYRDWQLCGDDAFLQSIWAKVKKALEFCWIEGGWDGDGDGVMEGCQHNTMDVEYYGPNPQMGIWYLGALRAGEEMATHLGESDFAQTCRRLYQSGRAYIDEQLFNGEYYEHRIEPAKKVAASLRLGMGAAELADPDYQLGRGCLVDQLVGQFFAHVCGLGYLTKRAHVRQTLKSIRKYNHRKKLTDHFNCMRSYALGDESALLMASYPHERPDNPFPYFTEVMTGFEYTAAIGMLYEGQLKNGLQTMRDIRNRYDGAKRSPFDEAECGHHYARAMVAWAGVLALTGFNYSGVTKSIAFAAKLGTFFWSNGAAWGTVCIAQRQSSYRIALDVLYGQIKIKHFRLTGVGEHTFDRELVLRENSQRTFVVG